FSLTFDGLTAADNVPFYGFTVAPPDTVGDVGPNHYVQYTNLLVKVFNKTGGVVSGPFKLSSLFVGVPGLCASPSDRGDPQVLYDPIADRWVLLEFAFTTNPNGSIGPPPYHMCIAVSKTNNP